jgi:protein subunit release factor A
VIDKNDIDVKVYRDDTEQIDSAVRPTHKPTGITVESWDHKTQVANYEAAMSELERRVGAADASPSLLRRVRFWSAVSPDSPCRRFDE